MAQLARAEERLQEQEARSARPTVVTPEPTPSAHAPVADPPASAHAAPREAEEPATAVVDEPQFDEQAWIENPPTKPTETFSQAGIRGAKWDEMKAIGQAWDEWRAYEGSDVYAAHQVAAEAAATVEAVEVPDSAHAASGPVSSSAHAPDSTRPVFLSKFHEVKESDQEKQKVIDAVAAFEDQHQPTIIAGGRVGEKQFPKGIGPKSLDRHEATFDADVLALMRLREDRKAENRAWFREAAEAGNQIEAIRIEREPRDRLNWYLDADVQELNRKRQIADRRRKAQLARMEEGDFTPTRISSATGGGGGKGSPDPQGEGQRVDRQPGE